MQPCCIRVTAVRGVAQPGSVLAWGARGRVFESHRSDQNIEMTCKFALVSHFFMVAGMV